MTEWQCTKCGEWWPAYSTLDAYRKHMRRRLVHPDLCERTEGSVTR